MFGLQNSALGLHVTSFCIHRIHEQLGLEVGFSDSSVHTVFHWQFTVQKKRVGGYV